jgi:uncharacterized protein YbaR (Trm112 family)
MFSATLLEILVCPACHQALELRQGDGRAVGGAENAAEDMSREWLRCLGCGLCYPIQDGIPVMLEERATREPH